MIKNKIALVMSAAMIIGSFSVSFAETAIAPDMNFTGDPINISLQQATEQMLKEGPGAETAVLNRNAADATAKGYSESYKSIEAMLDSYGVPLVVAATLPTKADADLVKIQSGFAKSQGPFNYEAALNKLKSDTIENYFTVLQAADALKINQENLAVQERIFTNTQKKFELGVVSKQDVLQAEVAVLSAKDAVTASGNGLNLAKMGLNNFLGYSVMQNLVLTDTLTAVETPATPLADAITMAIANRNEIKAAAFGVQIQGILMSRMEVRYPSNASVYLKQKVANLNAQAGYKQAVSGIEIDVRSKFMTMMQNKDAMATGAASVVKAKELLRLAELSYSVGMNTIADVQQVQVMTRAAELSLSKAILDYNLAVQAYNTAMSVGTYSAPL